MLRSVTRVLSVVALGVSLVASSTGVALARGGRGGGGGGMRAGGGGGGAYRGGGGGSYHGGGGAAQRSVGGGQYGGRATQTARPAATQHNVTTGNRNVGTGNRQANVNRTNVNVNRNTVVRPAAGGYGRAPYAHGGRRYYGNNAYRYHGYRGYGWGGGFRPVGAFVGALAVGAAVVAVAGVSYHYYQGVWYEPYGDGYNVVPAPIGATVATVPSETVNIENNYYYYGGTYYEKEGDEYKVVAPEAGTVVEHLPEGGEEVTVGEHKYVKFGETYYQPIQKDGKDMYEVVEVREGEE